MEVNKLDSLDVPLKIVDINLEDNIKNFDSLNGSLDSYLKGTTAYYEHIMKFANTKLVKIDNDVVAYFTLQSKNFVSLNLSAIIAINSLLVGLPLSLKTVYPNNLLIASI